MIPSDGNRRLVSIQLLLERVGKDWSDIRRKSSREKGVTPGRVFVNTLRCEKEQVRSGVKGGWCVKGCTILRSFNSGKRRAGGASATGHDAESFREGVDLDQLGAPMAGPKSLSTSAPSLSSFER